MSAENSKKVWIVATLSVLIVGVAAWALTGLGSDDEPAAADTGPAVPEEFSKDRLAALVQRDERQGWELFRQIEERQDLSEEQRQKIRETLRDLREAEEDRELDEYFNATPEERRRIIDKDIDEDQARDKAREEERAAEDPATREQREQEREKRREEWRKRMANMSQGERKERSETRDPNRQAQRMAYREAKRAREAERGIQRPDRGPGGGGGGRGGRPW